MEFYRRDLRFDVITTPETMALLDDQIDLGQAMGASPQHALIITLVLRIKPQQFKVSTHCLPTLKLYKINAL